MDLAQLAQAAGGGGTLYAILKLIEWAIKTWNERRKTAAETGQLVGATAKVTAEARVAESADYRAWADRADKRAERAEERLDAAETAAREARAQAEQARRDFENLREEMADFKAHYDELVAQIRSCRAGTACPVAEAIQG